MLDINRPGYVSIRSVGSNEAPALPGHGKSRGLYPGTDQSVIARDPSTQDVQEAIDSNSYAAALARKVVDRPLVLPAGCALNIALSRFSDLPEGLAATLGMGISSAALVYDAYKEWRKEQDVAERNYLFFYYGAGKRLGRGH